MRTNIDIDDRLMQAVLAETGLTTNRDRDFDVMEQHPGLPVLHA